MSHIGEHRGFSREAKKAREEARFEADPNKREGLLCLADEYEREADHAWSAARQEAHEDERGDFDDDVDEDDYEEEDKS